MIFDRAAILRTAHAAARLRMEQSRTFRIINDFRDAANGALLITIIITMDTVMRPHAVDHRLPSVTRRDFLRVLLAALAVRLRPLATRFMPIADELRGRLTCWRTSAPRLVAGFGL